MPETSAERIQQFRNKAAELRTRAGTITDSDLRQQLMELARGYDALADAIERRLYRH